jgi:hypothetical protein
LIHRPVRGTLILAPGTSGPPLLRIRITLRTPDKPQAIPPILQPVCFLLSGAPCLAYLPANPTACPHLDLELARSPPFLLLFFSLPISCWRYIRSIQGKNSESLGSLLNSTLFHSQHQHRHRHHTTLSFPFPGRGPPFGHSTSSS